MQILSIQSEVAYGYVGNSIARPALQALGHEVCALPSVVLSNHLGYGSAHKLANAIDLGPALYAVGQRMKQPFAVISGYLACPQQADALAEFLAAHPNAFYLLDPVMGDVKPGLYVNPELPNRFKTNLLPSAQSICLNAFEAEIMFGGSGVQTLLNQPQSSILVTSVPLETGLGLRLKHQDQIWQVQTPELKNPERRNQAPVPNGLGDLASALLLDAVLGQKSPQDLLPLLTTRLFRLLKISLDMERRELHLPSLSSVLTEPAQFNARRLA